MEETAKVIALYLSLAVEVIGAVVIAIGLLRFLYAYLGALFQTKHHRTNSLLRVQFGATLTIALELLLAADILRTAVAPTWDDIGKLAAIAAIRTALNYFLEKELQAIERNTTKGGTPDPTI